MHAQHSNLAGMQAFQYILWYTGVQTKVPDFRSITYLSVQHFQDLLYTQKLL